MEAFSGLDGFTVISYRSKNNIKNIYPIVKFMMID